MATNIKRTKAIGALRKAGASHENAVRILRHGYIDLDEPFGPQIEEIQEDFPDLFEAAPEDDTSEDDEPQPQTAMERKIAALRGEGNPYVHKRPSRPEPESKATKSAQELAEFFQAERPSTRRNKPPARQWIEPVRDINGDHKPLTREPNATAQQLAARLKGN